MVVRAAVSKERKKERGGRKRRIPNLNLRVLSAIKKYYQYAYRHVMSSCICMYMCYM